MLCSIHLCHRAQSTIRSYRRAQSKQCQAAIQKPRLQLQHGGVGSPHLSHNARDAEGLQARPGELEAGIGVALLWSDMDGGQGAILEGIHAVAAGLKDKVIDVCCWQKSCNAAAAGDCCCSEEILCAEESLSLQVDIDMALGADNGEWPENRLEHLKIRAVCQQNRDFSCQQMDGSHSVVALPSLEIDLVSNM